MMRRPILGNSCSTSKPSMAARSPMIFSRSMRRAGMCHWPSLGAYSVRPRPSCRADAQRQVVGAADGEHAEVAVKHEQGFAHRVHDGLRERPRIFDVLERLYHAKNAG